MWIISDSTVRSTESNASDGAPRVALVHDYLTQFGGAERVLASLHDLFPNAPVHTSLVDYGQLPPEFRAWAISECFPRNIPAVLNLHRYLLPLYQPSFRKIGLTREDADVVLADSSAWAHNVGVSDDLPLVCYCHSPARFLYGDKDYLSPARLPLGLEALTPVLFSGLRRTDRKAAKRVDRYIANSQTVASRIRKQYGRDSVVIYPPVDVEKYATTGEPPAPEPWFLAVSRIVPHKRIDLVVETCTKYGIPLKVIGTGRALDKLRETAGPSVEFLGHRDDAVVADHLRRCRAFILPAAEDFGMTAVEAQAAGRPVIAYGAGGALESVIPYETGLFFPLQTPQVLYQTIQQFEKRQWDPARAIANAARFNTERFHAEISTEIEIAIGLRP